MGFSLLVSFIEGMINGVKMRDIPGSMIRDEKPFLVSGSGFPAAMRRIYRGWKAAPTGLKILFVKVLMFQGLKVIKSVKDLNKGAQNMNQPVIIIGIGELGGVFAKAFLHAGYPVYPVTRGMDINEAARNIPEPLLVLVAVAEKDFESVMQSIPAPWQNCIGLLQNELLPRDWQSHGINAPTVISVWFEKKKGMDYKVLIPSRVYGPGAGPLADALAGIDIACEILSSDDDLLYELVRKNVFVFTINIAGLVLADGATTEDLWSRHNELAVAVANEVIDVQEWLTGKSFDRQRLIDGLVEGIDGDPHHKCRGRSAPGRLERVISLADEAGLEIPRIRQVHKSITP
jgi:hypothetical protein